jgi:hypothetical protein
MVAARRDGKNVFYSLAGEPPAPGEAIRAGASAGAITVRPL